MSRQSIFVVGELLNLVVEQESQSYSCNEFLHPLELFFSWFSPECFMVTGRAKPAKRHLAQKVPFPTTNMGEVSSCALTELPNNNQAHCTLRGLRENVMMQIVRLMSCSAYNAWSAQDSTQSARSAQLLGDEAGDLHKLR
jgi:hypothetical protein